MAENLYTTLLETTLEYGQGHCRMIEMEKHNESATINYDCVGDKGLDFLDYHIHKICYKLKSNEFIQSMKIVFKNRNDGHLETLLDTAPNEEKTDEYELDDNEEIKEVRIWKKNDSVIGFEITTNKEIKLFLVLVVMQTNNMEFVVFIVIIWIKENMELFKILVYFN